MAINGYFFDGTTLGEASLAPYDDSEVAALLRKFGNCVIEDYANELNAYEDAVGSVSVDTGAAMVLGYLYENDAVATVAISSAANNRIDLITLRVDTAAQTVRLTSVTGVEAANPSAPAVPATDFALFWVWLPAGYNSAADTVRDEDIHDMRDFNSLGTSNTGVPYRNLQPNSEFLMFSGANTGTLSAPEGWYPEATLTSINVAPTGIPRGRAQSVRIVSNAGLCITSEFPIITGQPYVIKGILNITAGAVSIELSTTTAGVITKEYRQTGTEIEFTIRCNPVQTVVGTLEIRINALSAATDFYFGQFMIIEGNIPGGFCPHHEVIWSNFYLNDSSWNMTAKSTGTTTIAFGVSFSNNMGDGMRGAILALRGRDSGSAANSVKLGVYAFYAGSTANFSQLRLRGKPNDKQGEVMGYVALDHLAAGGNFVAGVAASAAATFDAELRVQGIIT